jgi:hypothetical protein
MAQPRRGMISPALEGSSEEGARRQQIRAELAAGLSRFRDPSTIKDRSQMPQEGQAPWQQGQEMGMGPEIPPTGGPGGPSTVQAMIADYLGPKIISVPPEVLEELRVALEGLKRQGWLTMDAVKYVCDAMERGRRRLPKSSS